MSTPIKQNKGQKVKKMSDPHKAGSHPLTPSAGTKAVRFAGTMVHSDAGTHVSKPSAHNAGSHDHKAREHGGQ